MPDKYKKIFEERNNINENFNPTNNLDKFLFEEFYVDTWYNKPFFGRVDTSGYAVIPREKRLKFVSSAKDLVQVQALDFVAQLFKEFRQDYEANYRTNNLSKKSEFFKESLPPLAGFTTSRPVYLDKIKNLYSIFLDHIIENNFLDLINDYESFIQELKKFIYDKDLYFTRVGFVESKDFSPLQSGLSIDIYKDSGFKSSLKERFYTDINYPAFLELALRHGFIMNKEIPWRMTCDIRQAKIAQRISELTANLITPIKEEDLVSNLQKLFDVYYERVLPVDVKEFQYFIEFINIVEGLYKSFVFQFPEYRTLKVNNCGRAMRTKIKKKEIIVFKNNIELYRFYLSMFFDFRKAEIRDNIDDSKFNYLKVVAISNYDKLSKENLKKAVCDSIALFTNNTSTLPFRERSIVEGGPLRGPV